MAEKTRVIVLDTEQGRRQALAAILRSLGYSTVTATENIGAVMELEDPETVACVFFHTDIDRGRWLSFLKEARKLFSYGSLPMVILNASPTKGAVLAAYQAGVNGVLRFPCSSDDVESVLKLVQ